MASVMAARSSAEIFGVDEENPVEVMVLGTWHFVESTSDLAFVQPVDVLSPSRQAGLAETVLALAKFDPTVVVTQRVQLALRLAKLLLV